MEKKRSSREKIEKIEKIEKWQANTDAHTAEMYSCYDFTERYIESRKRRRRILLLDAYAYLALRRIRVPVRCNRVIIHIRKSPGRAIILARNSRPIKRRNLSINR